MVTRYKRYHVIVELDVHLKDTSLVVHTAEGIENAVRHALRTCLPTGSYTKGGYKFDPNTVYAEVRSTELEKANV